MKKLKFPEGQHLSVRLYRLISHPIHIHDGIEIMYVINGSVKVKISYGSFIMEKGDFIVINGYEVHSAEPVGEAPVIGSIFVGNEIFSPKEGLIMWDKNSLKSNVEAYGKLSKKIEEIIIASINNNSCPKDVIDYMHDIFLLLRINYKWEKFNLLNRGRNPYFDNATILKSLNSLLIYMYTRYDEKLTLETVANHFSFSKYYFSHFIKQAFGMSFQECLNKVRADRAEIEILGTSNPIGDICYQMGFSSPHYFSKYFKSFFELTPSAYRSRYRKETITYKNIEEDYKAADPAGIIKYFNGEQASDDGNCIGVQFSEGDYDIEIIKNTDNSAKIEKFNVRNSRKLHFKVDCDEMIMIIRKQ